MSHYTDITTGRYIMTEVNALRHFIKLAKKALYTNSVINMQRVYNEATYHLDVDKCFKCKYDDFGYCYFRGKNSIDENTHYRICFENWIKSMEHELNRLIHKK